MSIKSHIRKAALKFGVEINRFNPAQSHQAKLLKQLSDNSVDLVIDVGANDGGYSSFVRDAGYRGAILSFEPLSDAHSRLTEVAKRDPKWFVAPRVALGDRDCAGSINVAANSTSSSLLPMLPTHIAAAPQSRYESSEDVTVRRLDGFEHPAISRASNLFLKLDVQGFEMAVLKGTEGLMERVRGIQLECSLVPLYEGQTLFIPLAEWMSHQGYELWDVIPGFVDPGTGRMLQMDCVFFKGGPSHATP